MADGTFPGLVSKDANLNATSNPIYVQLSDGTSAIGVTSGSLDVNLTNASIVVTATDLDIRDLSYTQDSILIYANTAKDGSGTDYVPLVDADGKIIISNPGGTEYNEDDATPATIVGTATMFERDDVLSTITPAEGDWASLRCNARGALWVELDPTNDVSINDGGNSITVDDGGTTLSIDDGGGSITVDAVDLDIRALDHVTIGDSVRIGDGTETWSIDASGYGQIDIAEQSLTAIKISKDANANSETNPIYVKEVDTVVSGEEVHDYDTTASVGAGSSDNHDYATVGTTFFLKSVIVSASGNMKFEIQVDNGAGYNTVAVGFLTGRQGDTKQVTFDPAIEATTGVRIIRTNRQLQTQDVYSTIIGNDV